MTGLQYGQSAKCGVKRALHTCYVHRAVNTVLPVPRSWGRLVQVLRNLGGSRREGRSIDGPRIPRLTSWARVRGWLKRLSDRTRSKFKTLVWRSSRSTRAATRVLSAQARARGARGGGIRLDSGPCSGHSQRS